MTCVHHPDSIRVAHPSSGSCSVMQDLCGMLIWAQMCSGNVLPYLWLGFGMSSPCSYTAG